MINGISKISAIGGMGYLASPYSKFKAREGCSDKLSDFDWAAHDIEAIAGKMLLSGIVVISPIASSHYISKHLQSTPGVDKSFINSHAFWMPIDERLYNRCDYGIMAMMDSWEISTGMAIEFGQLTASGKQVLFYDPRDFTLYTVGEVSRAYQEQLADFLKLSAERSSPPYLHASIANQIVSTREILLRLSGVTKVAFHMPDPDSGGIPNG